MRVDGERVERVHETGNGRRRLVLRLRSRCATDQPQVAIRRLIIAIERYDIANYKGKKLVLYFYPKDDTPGCTAEACSLRDNYQSFLSKGFDVLGVSPDSVKKHVKFQEKYSLPFALLSDESHAVSEAYGVWGEKKFMGRAYMGIHRTTFVIDENGKIERIIAKVNTDNHAEQVMEK